MFTDFEFISTHEALKMSEEELLTKWEIAAKPANQVIYDIFWDRLNIPDYEGKIPVFTGPVFKHCMMKTGARLSTPELNVDMTEKVYYQPCIRETEFDKAAGRGPTLFIYRKTRSIKSIRSLERKQRLGQQKRARNMAGNG